MSLAPHQKRVVDEKDQNDDRVRKLGLFIGTQTFMALDMSEQARLVRQYELMTELSLVLAERIAAF